MKYTVKRGDSLSRIARSHGTTLSKLLDANPRFRANPDRINVGDVLDIAENGPTSSRAGRAPAKTASAVGRATRAIQPDGALGKLSAKYETGKRGPGTVSTGRGDAGGVSYGSYQMTSRNDGGTVGRFVSQPGFLWRREFQGLAPGSPEFTRVWKDIAAREPDAFQQAQHGYIKKTHYDPLVRKIQQEDGLKVNARSNALRDVVWSTAVQHGPNNSIVSRALRKVRAGLRGRELDRALIVAIYAERGRRRSDGNLAYFSRNSPAVQQGVARRFVNEEQDALQLLEAVA
jgi:LysM repeat protein